MKYLYILQQALAMIITIFWFYQIGISACSLIKIKDRYQKINKNHKFMAIIPANNEEEVISNLIHSLKMQDYPAELLDVYVIADNCTDNTADIAKKAGAIVYERFDERHKTKGYALQWFFNKLKEENANYDALCIFDADNVADKNFIKNMNKKLCQGEEVVQGYRDIKNPTDSWVAGGYAIFYWTMNRFYHLARYNIGLSPLINGTGFMVKYDIIKEKGWQTQTLTEDIEFSLQRICEGKRLGWAVDAIVYDEQPVDFKPSVKQRARWTVGHIQCMKHYTKELFNNTKKTKSFVVFDGLLYILGIPIMLVTLSLLLVNLIMFLGDEMTLEELAVHYGKYIISTFILPILSGVFIMFLDKRKIRPMLKSLICYPAFLGSWLVINLKCLVKRDIKWEKIRHMRNVNIDSVDKEVI